MQLHGAGGRQVSPSLTTVALGIRGWHIFFLNGRIVNTLGIASHPVSVTHLTSAIVHKRSHRPCGRMVGASFQWVLINENRCGACGMCFAEPEPSDTGWFPVQYFCHRHLCREHFGSKHFQSIINWLFGNVVTRGRTQVSRGPKAWHSRGAFHKRKWPGRLPEVLGSSPAGFRKFALPASFW